MNFFLVLLPVTIICVLSSSLLQLCSSAAIEASNPNDSVTPDSIKNANDTAEVTLSSEANSLIQEVLGRAKKPRKSDDDEEEAGGGGGGDRGGDDDDGGGKKGGKGGWFDIGMNALKQVLNFISDKFHKGEKIFDNIIKIILEFFKKLKETLKGGSSKSAKTED